MGRDKKNRGGRIRFVLPRSIGRVELTDAADRGRRSVRRWLGETGRGRARDRRTATRAEPTIRRRPARPDPPDDGPGRRAADLPGPARAVRLGRAGARRARVAASRDVPGVGPKLAEKIARARQEFDAEAELALCRRTGVADRRPRRRRLSAAARATSPTRPACSTCRGRSSRRDQLAIALVGSRHCTPYGMRIAERLAGVAGAGRPHGRLGPGPRDRRRRPPRGPQGGRPDHRRPGQRPGRGLSARARGPGPRGRRRGRR